jgi:O-methyltransferase involved in polyketide biosynthesis
LEITCQPVLCVSILCRRPHEKHLLFVLVRSAVNLGYLEDAFSRHFVSAAAEQRRSPLINRGTFARISAVQLLVRRFLAIGLTETSGEAASGAGSSGDFSRQVLSLGSGFDPTALQLQHEGDLCDAAYFELDFLAVTQRKAEVIQREPQLMAALTGLVTDTAAVEPDYASALEIDVKAGSVTMLGDAAAAAAAAAAGPGVAAVATTAAGEGSSSSSTSSKGRGQYCLRAVDLRDLEAVRRTLLEAGFRTDVPTLVVAECVLIYMDAKHSDAIISWAGQELQQAAFVVYEQIQPHDGFGQQMVQNIAARGCPLRSIGPQTRLPHCLALLSVLLYPCCGRLRFRCSCNCLLAECGTPGRPVPYSGRHESALFGARVAVGDRTGHGRGLRESDQWRGQT